MKKSIIFIILLIAIIVGFRFLGKDKNDVISKNDSIVVGLDVNFPPMGFLNENGEIEGFDIDLAKAVFEDLGKEVIFQSINWDAKEMELNNGNIDAIWNGLSYTAERAENMTLTKSYMKNRQVVIVKADSDIKELEDLKGKVVSVQKGSTGASAIKANAISSELKEIFEVESVINALNEVKMGLAEGTVVDEIVARYYLEENNLVKDFKILDKELESEDYVIAVKKGNEDLKNDIEKALANLIENKKAEEISNKWFGERLVNLEQVK